MTDEDVKSLVTALLEEKLRARNENELSNQKDVAYYAALVNGWLTTRFELDKSLLTLSAGGIGLTVTLLTTLGVPSRAVLVLQGLAIVFFLGSVLSVFWIFDKNAEHLRAFAKNEPAAAPPLKWYDRIAVSGFIIGVVLLLVVGVISATTKLPTADQVGREVTTKGNTMRKPQGSAPMPIQGGTDPATHKKSVDGVGELRPAPAQQKPVTPPPKPAPSEPSKGGSGGDGKS